MKYIKYYFQTLPILSFEMHTLRVARALKSVKWKCALYGFGTIYIIVILYSHSLVKALWYLYFTYQTEVKSCLFLFCLLWGKMHCVNFPKGEPWPSTSRLINLYAYCYKVAREFIRFLMNVHQNRNFSAFQYMFQLYWAINLYAKFSKSRDVYTSIHSWYELSYIVYVRMSFTMNEVLNSQDHNLQTLFITEWSWFFIFTVFYFVH